MLNFSDVETSCFRDEKFMKWARRYLRRVCEEAAIGTFDLADKLTAIMEKSSKPLTLEHWDELYNCHRYRKAQIYFFNRPLIDFLYPLSQIYNTEPDILESRRMFRMSPKKRRKGGGKCKGVMFDDFANGYLKLFFHQVVRNNVILLPSHHYLWQELHDAAEAIKSVEKFSSLAKWLDIPDRKIHIRHKALRDFVAPLRKIYDKADIRRRLVLARPQHFRRERLYYPGPKSNDFDLRDIPAETIDVTVFPVELKSKIEGDGFGRAVIKLLTHCLKVGYSWIPSGGLADALRVDQREFENWADENSDLVSKIGTLDGRVYYGLRPLDQKGVTTMNSSVPGGPTAGGPTAVTSTTAVPTQEDFCHKCGHRTAECKCKTKDVICPKCSDSFQLTGIPDPAVVCVCPHCKTNFYPSSGTRITTTADDVAVLSAKHPDIGTDEFDTLITQVLSEKSVVWRSSEAIVALGYDAEEFHKWAADNPAVTNRMSTKGTEGKPRRLYALHKRLEAVKSVEDNKDDKKPGKKKSEKGETSQQQKKLIGPSITQQESLAFAMLHRSCDDLVRVMNFYANGLATRHEEAFANFTKAQKFLSAGVALLQKDLKISDKKLPALEDI